MTWAETPCILHKGCTLPNGYGQVRREGKTWLAHRWAAHIAHGPSSQVVRHKCDVRACIEPTHLEYGTQGQNLSDRKDHGHVYRKLDRLNVKDIKTRIERGESLASIARLYGVSDTMVRHIKGGRQWSEV